MSLRPLDQQLISGNSEFKDLLTELFSSVQRAGRARFYIKNTGVSDVLIRANGDTAVADLPTILAGKDYWLGGEQGIILSKNMVETPEVGNSAAAWSIAVQPWVGSEQVTV